MAAPIVRIKRSSQAGKIPTNSQLLLGELAINTTDGKVYIEQERGGVGVGTTVIAVNPWNVGLGGDAYDINFTAGDVGVGTDNPTRKLDVEIQTANGAVGSVLDSHPIAEFINLSDGAPRGLEIGSPADSIYSPVYLKVSGTSNRFAILDQHNDENFTILDNGNVGIGSTTPTEKLDVIGTAKVDGLKFGSGTAVTSVDTDLSSVSASDDTLASAKAIKSYVDAQATAQDLDFAGDTGSGSIDLDSETFTIVGTENEIQTVGSGNTLTIGLTETGVTADTYGSSTQVSQFTVDENGRITSASSVNIDFGNANVATADSLTNSRAIEATGDISWAVNFKGHENVSADATLTSIITPGTVGSSTQVGVVTFDAKGRITSASNVNIDFGNANVATADSLTNSRNIAATGDISWNVDFKGHEDVSGIATLKDVGPGLGDYGDTTGKKYTNFSLDSKGRVTGINTVSIVFSDANVATADSLTNSRNIAATGDIAWNVDFKGHEDVSGIATLSDTGVVAGTYGSSTQVGIVTVDSKGRITSASNTNIDFGNANVATASQVSTGTTTGTTSYYPTFVDSNNSTRQNESLYTDAGISYNPNTNALNLTGALTVGGTLTANGNVDLGNNNSDTVTFTAKVDSNILPSTNNTRDLGSSSLKWNEVYATTVVGAIIGNADTADYATRAGLATDLAINASNRLLYQASNNNTGVLPAGTSGQLLKSNGTSAPSWVNASSVGKTYTLTAVDSGTNAILRLGDGTTNDDVKITAGSNITINPVAAGGFTIAASIPFNNYARAINTTRVLSYSATWVNTQTSVTINKQSSSSAIYITIEDALYAGNLGGHRLLRGSTVLVQSSANSFGATPSGSIGWYGRQSITYIDNTTATGNITYKTQIRLVTSNGFVAVNNNNLSGVNTRCTAVAIEI